MARICTICSHPETEAIDEAIVAGQAHTRIAARYGLNNQAVRRHAENHLPDKLVKAVADAETDHAESILDGINDLMKRTKRIMDDAEKKGYGRLELEGIREMRNSYELLSKIMIRLTEYQQVQGSGGDDTAPRTLAELYDEESGEMGSLDMLTAEEIKLYNALQAKIAGTIPEDDRDNNTRLFVEGVNESTSYDGNSSGNSALNSPRAEHTQTKNIKKGGATGSGRMRRTKPVPASNDFDLELDDLDDFDLSLDEPAQEKAEKSFPSTGNHQTIPSEDTDPDWLKKERAKNPSRYYRP